MLRLKLARMAEKEASSDVAGRGKNDRRPHLQQALKSGQIEPTLNNSLHHSQFLDIPLFDAELLFNFRKLVKK